MKIHIFGKTAILVADDTVRDSANIEIVDENRNGIILCPSGEKIDILNGKAKIPVRKLWDGSIIFRLFNKGTGYEEFETNAMVATNEENGDVTVMTGIEDANFAIATLIVEVETLKLTVLRALTEIQALKNDMKEREGYELI